MGLWTFITAVVCLVLGGELIVRIIKASKPWGVSPEIVERIKELEDDLSECEQDLEETRARLEVLEKIIADEAEQTFRSQHEQAG